MDLLKHPQLKPLIDIPRMAELAQEMVRDALNAFINGDDPLAKQVCERDDQVDKLNDQVFRELLTYMMQDPGTIPRAVDLILVGRHLERIADHATNIGEDVIFMVKGKTIKHHAEERREALLKTCTGGKSARVSRRPDRYRPCQLSLRTRTSMSFSPLRSFTQFDVSVSP